MARAATRHLEPAWAAGRVLPKRRLERASKRGIRPTKKIFIFLWDSIRSIAPPPRRRKSLVARRFESGSEANLHGILSAGIGQYSFGWGVIRRLVVVRPRENLMS
jgi:hypothetical protein